MKKLFTERKPQKIFCTTVIAIGCILMFWAGTTAAADLFISLPLMIILSAGIFIFAKQEKGFRSILLLPLITSLIFAALNIFAAIEYNLDPTLAQPDGSYPAWGYTNVLFSQLKTLCIGAVLSSTLLIADIVKSKKKKA